MKPVEWFSSIDKFVIWFSKAGASPALLILR